MAFTGFTGEFRHAIDAKGRLIVPSRMRETLTDDTVVLTRWTDGCIALFSSEGWASFERSLIEQRKNNPEARTAVRLISASAHPDTVDRQGRIGVPQHLRDHAGIDREVVITGVIDRAEIWSPERWEQLKLEGEGGGLSELFDHLDL